MTEQSITVAPADEQELVQTIESAAADRASLEIIGGGTKQGIGYPQRQPRRVSTAKLDRIVDYDPSELVLTVEAGVRLNTVQALLDEHDQMLAFEPPELGPQSTIGGVIAAGFAGPRRVSAGNVRDHVLGFTAVSGRGERFVAGGRVVKNVTGYDLSKLMCGSWGQLAVLTRVTLKVLPRPKVSLTLAAHGLDIERAFATMTQALRSQGDVSAAAHAPAGSIADHAVTLLRLEGFGPSVEARATLLIALVAERWERLEPFQAEEYWSEIRNDPASHAAEADTVWRICVPSTRGADTCRGLEAVGGSVLADWGGALIWARLSASVPGEKVRGLAERMGGHATLFRAPDHYRERVGALHPEAAGVAALSRRVKVAFDPTGILDPHRFEEPAQ